MSNTADRAFLVFSNGGRRRNDSSAITSDQSAWRIQQRRGETRVRVSHIRASFSPPFFSSVCPSRFGDLSESATMMATSEVSLARTSPDAFLLFHRGGFLSGRAPGNDFT